MRTNLRAAAPLTLLSFAIFQASTLQAAITVIDHWKIADGDPGAANGVTPTNFADSVGAHSLAFVGTGIYTNDVASAAWAHANSSGSVNLTGGFAYSPVVSTAINNYGIEAWVRLNATNANGSAVIYNGHTGTSGWGIAFNGTSYQGLMGGQEVVGTITPQLGVWTHVAFVRDNGFSTLYSNGVAVAISGTGPNTPAGNFAIGIVPQQAPGGGPSIFQGEVDEGRVFTFTAGAFSTNDLLVNATNFALGRSSIVLSSAAQTNSITLSVTPANANWTASTNATWLHLINQNGSGSTNVAFIVDTNSGATRSGVLTIAGQAVAVTQAGAAFVPATVMTIGDSLSTPRGVAVDAAGNVFASDSGFEKVFELPAGSNHWVPLIQSGLSGPFGLAVDNMGDLFVADSTANAIKEWTLANSNFTALPIGGLNFPLNVAVDGANNLYIADYMNDAVEAWSNNTGTVTTIISAGNLVGGVAVDRAGNVYAAANGPLKERFAASGTVVSLPFAYTASSGISVDGSGNVISPDVSFTYEIEEFLPSAGLSKVVTTAANYPNGTTVDAAGDIFYSSTYDGVVKELQNAFVNPALVTEGANAGTGSLPAVVPATANLSGAFVPTSDQSWLTITGVTNGVVSFSFAANPLNNGNRTAHIHLLGVSVPVTQTGVVCNVGVTSVFEGSGSGTDSVALGVSPVTSAWSATANDSWLHLSATNQSGVGSTNVIFTFDANPSTNSRIGSLTIGGRTVSVTQVGIAFQLGSQSTVLISNSFIVPSGLAATAAGEVFISDSGGSKEISHYTTSQGIFEAVANNTSLPPQGLALDSSTNIYWTDSQSVQEAVPPFPTTPFAVVTSGLANAPALAIDPATNIYIAQPLSNAIVKWSPAFSNATAVTGPLLPNISALAVDIGGNIYAASASLNEVIKWNAATGGVKTIASGLHSPTAIAADGSGNIYYNDSSTGQILKLSAVTGATTAVATGIGSNPLGLGLDALENIYIADTANHRVEAVYSAYVANGTVSLPNYASVTTLPAIVPALALPYQLTPTTDVPWIASLSIFNGVVNFRYYPNTGAPRTGHITLLGVPITINQAGGFVPPTLTGTAISGGQLHFNFAAPGGGGGTFTVLTSTNVTLALSQWTFLNYPSYLGGNNYTFSTPVNTNEPARFYIVVAP